MAIDLLVIGAGGHAKVVLEAILAQGVVDNINLTDQDEQTVGKKLLEKFVVEPLMHWEKSPEIVHVAIGNNVSRKRVAQLAFQHGKQFMSIIHPDANISSFASIGKGSFVAAKSVIAADCTIEFSCIINHGAVVDHDCVIGAFSHIAPNATVCGGVTIGCGSLVGAGSVILPGIKVGENAVIGAGATVIKDVPKRLVVGGVPANRLKL
jgi:sugar O-acyltransferase (sialic acid O-acetyltransferase NeuD family)